MVQDRWFRDFNDTIHQRISQLDAKDIDGRMHLHNLLHIGWLFKKGLEHYVAEGERAKWTLQEMMDAPKKPWYSGIV